MQSTASSRTADGAFLATFEGQIAHLEKVSSPLYADAKVVQDRLNSYHYPFMSLPNEIISEIFLNFIPPYPTRASFSGTSSPTRLMQICGHWRQIALSTPALWRAFQLTHDATSPPLCRVLMSTAAIWLQRSQALLLSIEIRGHAIESKELAEAFMAVILPYKARWEYVELSLPGPDLYLCQCIDGPLPLLAHLSICGSTAVSLPPATAPVLSSVTIRNACKMHIEKQLPWQQLTTLYLLDVYPSTAGAILKQTSALVRCRIKVIFGDEEQLSVAKIHLPVLESLIYEFGRGCEDFVRLLKALRVPNLRQLLIQEDLVPLAGDNVGANLALLAALISSLGYKLERLAIASCVKWMLQEDCQCQNEAR